MFSCQNDLKMFKNKMSSTLKAFQKVLYLNMNNKQNLQLYAVVTNNWINVYIVFYKIA